MLADGKITPVTFAVAPGVPTMTPPTQDSTNQNENPAQLPIGWHMANESSEHVPIVAA